MVVYLQGQESHLANVQGQAVPCSGEQAGIEAEFAATSLEMPAVSSAFWTRKPCLEIILGILACG